MRKIFQKTNISYLLIRTRTKCKKCTFFRKFWARTKWMILKISEKQSHFPCPCCIEWIRYWQFSLPLLNRVDSFLAVLSLISDKMRLLFWLIHDYHQRRIQNSVKHLRSSVLRKYLTAGSLTIFFFNMLYHRCLTGFWIRRWSWKHETRVSMENSNYLCLQISFRQ